MITYDYSWLNHKEHLISLHVHKRMYDQLAPTVVKHFLYKYDQRVYWYQSKYD